MAARYPHAKLHEMVAAHVGEPDEAVVGIELDRGLLVNALLVAAYHAFAINPLSVDRYRDRHSTSGADSGDHCRVSAHRLGRLVGPKTIAEDCVLPPNWKRCSRSHPIRWS